VEHCRVRVIPPRCYAYGYDAAGNRTTEQIDDSPAASVYNNMNRLMSQDGGGGLTFRGTLSEGATVTVQGKPATVGVDNGFEGKAQAAPGTNTVAVVATDPSANIRTNTYEVGVSAGPKTFLHDANGSLETNGTKGYEWDGQNRLTRALDGGSETARFSYDGFGRRAQKVAGGVTRSHIYDGEDTLEERLSTGGTIRYVHGPGIDQPLASIGVGGAVSYYLTDHLGSVVQATDSAGQVTLTRQYDAYGNLLAGSSVSGYAFTGREWDGETSLYYYRARYYDPKIGRFISEDPIGFGGGINFYAYVENNPVSRLDPFGLDWWEVPGRARRAYDHTRQAWNDFYRNYQNMRSVRGVDGADKYFHCMANCEGARHGAMGMVTSIAISEGREYWDQYVKKDPPAACEADRRANTTGRSGDPDLPCEVVCAPHRPPGMPPRY